MRILLTSDLHYKLRQFDWLIAAAAQFDVVVVAGDHLDANGAVPGEVQIAALLPTFAAVARAGRLLVCSGNHDLTTHDEHGEKAASWMARLRGEVLGLDGDTVRVADTLFTVCPWWDGPVARAAIEDQLEVAALQRAPGERWVWIHHAPPECALSWNGRRHYGDAALAALIARHQPDAVLCGHIHEAPFRPPTGSWVTQLGETWLFNAGHQIGNVPSRIEIDFGRAEARWISLAGVEEQALA